MIYVIATIEIESGRRDEFLAEFRQLVPKVLEEQGALEYAPTIDIPTEIPSQPPVRDDVVTVMEKWEDTDALAAHLMAPHMVEYRNMIKEKEMVVGMSLQILQPV